MKYRIKIPVNPYIIFDTACRSPENTLMNVYRINPQPIPSAILNVNTIISTIRIAGKYSVKSSKLMPFRLLAANKDPTMMSKAEMTASGIRAMKGINAMVNRK